MSMYFSRSTNWFYDDALYGHPFTRVNDPAWVRPTVEVVLQPGEMYLVGDVVAATNTGGEAKAFMVPDASAVPTTIEQANSACKLPADAVAVSDDDYEALMAAHRLGKVFSADEKGYPIVIDAPAPSAELLAGKARAQRDALIATTDYLVMPDYPINADRLAQIKTYRQALRDITTQTSFPTSVEWPTLPT